MAEIAWKEVESSNIEAIAYDATEEELYVRFNTGSEYVYSEVPEKIYNDFMDAGSKGRYFASSIKGVYDFEKR